ncbi:hypothetical protein GQ43DRAFT_404228 [Delitschia confertaspora ATCC 74209]|uniref:Uncharacterized protein n=1 Tax=Delitschia confertaspora ATCC 74209 TaxID=1513339 RepID=A0A9P4MN89_9PLEO|nr:hypothetical protein GQ43DRAFT_404228 [Delitschia confertaspora ATCC 74209]
MNQFKGIAKGGWHPSSGKDGGSSGGKLSTVSGLLGRAKDPHEAALEHQSTPLSALKDPASFGPPPKRVNYHVASTAAPGGLGAPLSEQETGAKQRLQAEEEARRRTEEEASKPSPGPYTVDTTGLSIAHLPKPPVRRADQELQQSNARPTPNRKPQLPPRLPPRQNSRPDAYTPEPPPSYNESTSGLLNQSALNRLGQAGISVPDLDIGRTASPPLPPRGIASPSTQPALSPARGPHLGELQSRFSKVSTSQHSTGSSLTEKQEALKTANNLRTDPSKVPLSDIRSAAATTNNFYERYGDQVSSGLRATSDSDRKYGAAGRAGGPVSLPPQSPVQGGLGKKPPPPPPPKKKNLSTSGAPPPVPLASKPK